MATDSDTPIGLQCPGCGDPPVMVFGGGTQAFCGNDDCAILTWNPAMTVEELAADMKVIKLPADPEEPEDPACE